MYSILAARVQLTRDLFAITKFLVYIRLTTRKLKSPEKAQIYVVSQARVALGDPMARSVVDTAEIVGLRRGRHC